MSVEIGAMDALDKRYTTVHDRYHIVDKCCGMVETAMNREEAMKIAQAHARRHFRDEIDTVEHIVVWDNMAKKGAASGWLIPVRHVCDLSDQPSGATIPIADSTPREAA